MIVDKTAGKYAGFKEYLLNLQKNDPQAYNKMRQKFVDSCLTVKKS